MTIELAGIFGKKVGVGGKGVAIGLEKLFRRWDSGYLRVFISLYYHYLTSVSFLAHLVDLLFFLLFITSKDEQSSFIWKMAVEKPPERLSSSKFSSLLQGV